MTWGGIFALSALTEAVYFTQQPASFCYLINENLHHMGPEWDTGYFYERLSGPVNGRLGLGMEIQIVWSGFGVFRKESEMDYCFWTQGWIMFHNGVFDFYLLSGL